MSDDQTESTKAPTWLDLMPANAPMPELLPRDEFLTRLRDRGIDLTSASFHYYRHRGILPRPIRRRVDGVTQAVYAPWLIPVIQAIRDMQARGKSLDEIVDMIQPVTKMWALSTIDWKDPLAESTVTMDAAVRQWAKAKQPWLGNPAINTIRVTLLDDAGDELDDPHEFSFTP
jgi:hypothetical protein